MPYLSRGIRRVTAKARPLPSVVGVGAMRSGTTALFSALSRHPELAAPTRKEIHFFDLHFARGINWYRAFFPVSARLAMEWSPSYMNHPMAARRAREVLGDARILVLLRDPVERAWSQYRLRRSLGTEDREFDVVLATEMEAPRKAFSEYAAPGEIPYLRAGLYADQLEAWLSTFGADSVLVLDSADVFSKPDGYLAVIQDFIGVDRAAIDYVQINASPAAPLPESLEALRWYFDDSDAKLQRMTGITFSWMRPSVRQGPKHE